MVIKKIGYGSLICLLLVACSTEKIANSDSVKSSTAYEISKLADVDKRGMTQADRDKSNKAKVIFDSFTKNNTDKKNYKSDLSTENKKVIGDWIKVKKKYSHVKSLNAEQAIEIGSVLSPMLRAADIEYRNNSGYQTNNSGSVIINPNSKVTMRITGHCLDPNIGAPSLGDKFQLVYIEKLIDTEILPLYKDVINYSSSHPEKSPQIQAIIWAIRKSCHDINQASRIQKEQLEILNEASNDGGKKFLKYLNSCHGTGNLIARSLFGDFVNNIANTQSSIGSVQDDLNRIINMPTSGSIATDNSDFTELGKGVVARATGEGGIQVKVEIVNTTGDSFVFDPSKYAAETQRKTQRVALIMPTVIDAITLHDDRSNRVMEAYLIEAARFLHDKTLQKSSSTTGIGELFTKILGSEVKSPAAKILLNSLPLLGSYIAYIEARDGKDWYTNESLSPAKRLLALAAIVPGIGAIERNAPGLIKSGLIKIALESLEKTERTRDVAGWVLSDTVDQFTESYSPAKYVDKQTEKLIPIFTEAARFSVNGLRGDEK